MPIFPILFRAARNTKQTRNKTSLTLLLGPTYREWSQGGIVWSMGLKRQKGVAGTDFSPTWTSSCGLIRGEATTCFGQCFKLYTLTISTVKLKTKYSHAMSFYKDVCEQSDFKPKSVVNSRGTEAFAEKMSRRSRWHHSCWHERWWLQQPLALDFTITITKTLVFEDVPIIEMKALHWLPVLSWLVWTNQTQNVLLHPITNLIKVVDFGMAW